MSGVSSKLALRAKPGIKAIECAVNRLNQWQDLKRHARLRQSQFHSVRTDLAGQARRRDDRLHRAPENGDVDHEEYQQDRSCNPADMGQKLSQDIVDQDIAMENVLDNLDQDRAAVEVDPYRRAVKGHPLRVVTKKLNAGAIGPDRRDRPERVLLKKFG